MSSHDARAIANALLDEADRLDYPLSNLSLQKLLYLAHGLFLIETGNPLMSGYFEAWKYGPVHPAAYRAFAAFGARAITGRARSIDPVTLVETEIPAVSTPEVIKALARIVPPFGGLTPGRLVDITHAKNSPWDVVIRSQADSAQLGLRISNELIVERFKFHKVSLGAQPNAGEPDEDTPYTGD